MPKFELTPETALGIFQAAMQIKQALSSGRENPDADFTDADALALLEKNVAEGLGLIEEYRNRPPTPPGS